MTKTRRKTEIGKFVFMLGIFSVFGIIGYLMEIYWLLIVGGAIALAYYFRSPPAIHLAIDRGWDDSEIMELIDDKTDIEEKDGRGNTPLHIAARCDRSSLIKTFIDLGADVNVQNKLGVAPLHWAVNFDARNAAKMLVGYGKADANLQDASKSTPMTRASLRRNYEMVNILKGDPST